MVCAGCGRAFEPDGEQAACRSCALLAAGCGRVRCPFCGYENQKPLKDAWSALVARWRNLVHGSPERP